MNYRYCMTAFLYKQQYSKVRNRCAVEVTNPLNIILINNTRRNF